MNPKLIKAYAKKRGISEGAAEKEIIEIVLRISELLAPNYKFGYHSVQDIAQQGVLCALEVLDKGKYDVNRPLENFLSIHIRNRLSNFRRDNYMRYESPCRCCDPHNPPALPCQKYTDWLSRNTAKQNLMRPLDMGNISDENENSMRRDSYVEDNSIACELRRIIDNELPIELRRDYLQMLNHKHIPEIRQRRVREAVLEITKKWGYIDGEKSECSNTG